MGDREPLLLERDGGVLTLVNNDPPINRMTFEYMDALERAVTTRRATPACACSSSPRLATRTSPSAWT